MLVKSPTSEKERRQYGKIFKGSTGCTGGSIATGHDGASVRGAVAPTIRAYPSRKSSQPRRQQTVGSASLDRRDILTGSTGRVSGIATTDEIGSRSSAGHDICDNSNDSGLGFEERQHQQQQQQQQQQLHHRNHNHHLNNTVTNANWNVVGEEDSKRRRMDIKLESEDANFAFPEVGGGARGHAGEVKGTTPASRCSSNGVSSSVASPSRAGSVVGVVGRVVGVSRPRPASGILAKRASLAHHQASVTLTSQLCSVSRDGKTQLQIMCQPEQQHRARYQTEGSRGAVKDRTGNGFPIVRLAGYDKPATLQVFIGTDVGRAMPHMFYQACRVSGKNSTPCVERKIDGTIVIEVDMDPGKEMIVTCDCVGILKERNVDVEHRFPQEAGILQGRSKKKSTRCRMVFRTTISHADGTVETLQICSQPIVCTQPPGIPEISKKSLTSCPCSGGLELFVLGKNFLKDTRIVFRLENEELSGSGSSIVEPPWECAVLPDKEFLQQTHLVCVVPPYRRQDLDPSETVSVKLYAVSSGKTSEPHTFVYTAASAAPEPSVGKLEGIDSPPRIVAVDPSAAGSSSAPATTPVSLKVSSTNPVGHQAAAGSGPSDFMTAMQKQQQDKQCPDGLKTESRQPSLSPGSQVTPVMMWASQVASCQNSCSDVIMPPPPLAATGQALLDRRSSSSLQLILPDNMKTEVLDDNSQSSAIGDCGMQSLAAAAAVGPMNVVVPSSGATSPLQQLTSSCGDSRDGTGSILGMVNVTANASLSPARKQPGAPGLLSVVDMMQRQLAPAQQQRCDAFVGIRDSPTTMNLPMNPRLASSDATSNVCTPTEGTACPGGRLAGSGVVVDLRTKQNATEFNAMTSFAAAAVAAASNPSGQVIERFLNQMESVTSNAADPERPDDDLGSGNDARRRGSIVPPSRSQREPPNILAPTQATVKLDALVNSAAETHQIGSPPASLPAAADPHRGSGSVARGTPDSDAAMPSPPIPMQQQQQQQTTAATTTSGTPIPMKTMILDALMPPSSSGVSTAGQPLTPAVATVTSPRQAGCTVEQVPEENLLTTIAAALLPPMQEPPVVVTATGTASAALTCVDATHDMPLHPVVSSDPIPTPAEEIQQMQALAQHQHQVQVEQVVAQAQQQVEQVVAQAQQQAVQAVHQAQQQAVQQVVQHAHVVQQAVQQVHAAQQVQAVPSIQQAFQQATQEVVQQAVQQATHEVVQQVQAVQQAVQQAQAAQAMQQAVQQDIGSMLNQPAGFVAEASSVLASGAAQQPSQQRLTTAAEQAINSVITNATQDIINNRPITTTTAHAIIATKNILNSVATQSAQLMNTAMEGILPKSPSGQANGNGGGIVVDHVAGGGKSAPVVPVPVGPSMSVSVTSDGNPTNPVVASNVTNGNVRATRKPDDAGVMLPQEVASMSDHDLLSYINPSCFDPQGGFLM